MAFTIGKLAKAADVNIETIRFYERQKLIEQPVKPAVGYRQYSNVILQRILFIKRAQELGFSLNEISALLSLEENNCHEIQSLTVEKLAIIRKKIADLSRLESVLNELVQQCNSTPEGASCPIVNSFNLKK